MSAPHAVSPETMAKLRQQKLSERYPNLLSELNDPASSVPAYGRFQDPNSCLLRDDLRRVKEQHFRRSYDANLKSHLKEVDKVQFRGGALDSQTYFKIKYFVTKDQKDKIMRDRIQELSEQLASQSHTYHKSTEHNKKLKRTMERVQAYANKDLNTN